VPGNKCIRGHRAVLEAWISDGSARCSRDTLIIPPSLIHLQQLLETHITKERELSQEDRRNPQLKGGSVLRVHGPLGHTGRTDKG
jgi:hypothetical protein